MNSNRIFLIDFISYSRESLLREYIQFLPYAIHITSYFLMSLVAPPLISPADGFEAEISPKEIIQAAAEQGGELVDREIAHQLKELYELSHLHNVQIEENIDTSKWAQEAATFINHTTELYESYWMSTNDIKFCNCIHIAWHYIQIVLSYRA